MSELDPKVLENLKKHGISYKVLPCDPDFADTAAFCEKYGYNMYQSANTILVADRKSDKVAACVLLADAKLDVNKKVRNLMEAKRVSFASAEQTRAATDMMIGGVTAFGLPPGMPVYIDEKVMRQKEVIMGGGNRSSKLILNPQEMLKLPDAEVIANLAILKS